MHVAQITLANGRPHEVHVGGWGRQKFDVRDEAYRIKGHPSMYGAATKSDLSPGGSPVENQGPLGACSDHGLAGLVEYEEKAKWLAAVRRAAAAAGIPLVSVANVLVDSKTGIITFNTSVTPAAAPAPTPTPPPAPASKAIRMARLFNYYATRMIEGTVSSDSGASIRDTIKSSVTYGVVDEALWPYDVSKFTVKPPQSVWDAAAKNKVKSYHSIADGDINTMKATLLGGTPITYGFDCYDYVLSDEMAAKGILSLPKKGEKYQGGHCVDLFGHDDNFKTDDGLGAFIVRNSWGVDWGLKGYFYMSYKYVQTVALCSDFWVITTNPFVA